MRNRICELLSIKYPIFSGGMAHVSKAKLAAAVSEAGGFGIIAAGGTTPSKLSKEIDKTRELTEKPFGVNLLLLDPDVEEKIEIVCEKKVDMVTTGAGNPGKYVPTLKKAGIKIFPLVPSTILVRRLKRYDIDGVIAEGMEAGGHIGEVTTMALLPQVCEVAEFPVVAAGGIASGSAMAACFALGAEGIQMGTRFAVSTESPMHPKYKQKIIEAGDRSTVVTGRTLGAPVRAIANKMTKTFERYQKEGRSREEFEELAGGGLKRAVKNGDLEMGSLMAGQIAGLIKDEKPVGDIVEQMVQEAKETCENLGIKLNDI